MLWKIILPSNKSYTLPSPPKTYSDLINMVNQRFNTETHGSFVLKYLDSEDELISLTTADDFDTAVIIEKREKLHTIKVYVFPAKNDEDSIGHKHVECESTDDSAKESSESIMQSRKFERKGSKRVQTLVPISSFEDSYTLNSRRFSSIPSKSHKMSIQKAKKHFNNLNVGPFKKFRGSDEPIQRNNKLLADKLIDEKIDQKLEEGTEGLASIVFNVIRKVYGEEALLSASQKALKDIEKVPNVCQMCDRRSKHMRGVCPSCFSKAFSSKAKTTENSPRYLAIDQSPSQLTRFHEKVDTCRVRTRKNTYPGFSYYCPRKNYLHQNTQNFKVRLTRLHLDDSLEVNCGEDYHLTFELQNNGDVKWPEDVRLVCINGRNKGEVEKIPALEPGLKHEVNISYKASKTPGKYLSQWRISYGSGENQRSFGESLFEEIYVREGGKQCKKGVKNSTSQDSIAGRQEQDLDTSCERKDSGTSEESREKELSELKTFDKIRCHEDRLKWAKFLNDIFPGDLDEKIDFMYGCTEQASIHDVVENYLIKLGKSKYQERITL